MITNTKTNNQTNEPLLKKQLEDGRVILLWQMIFNCRVQLYARNDMLWCEDEWCFENAATALKGVEDWDGNGDPPGWMKNPGTGRFNPENAHVQEMGWDKQWRTD